MDNLKCTVRFTLVEESAVGRYPQGVLRAIDAQRLDEFRACERRKGEAIQSAA